MRTIAAFALAATIALTGIQAVIAQPAGKGPGQGPVTTQCKSDIDKFCADKKHDGEMRACLEARKSEVTTACRTALGTTGAGKGRKQ
jgi:hypothetical protein